MLVLGTARRQRTLQRAVHLATGLVLLVYTYATGLLHPTVTSSIRWLVLPLLVLSGIAMWQWPRVRRLVRHRESGQ